MIKYLLKTETFFMEPTKNIITENEIVDYSYSGVETIRVDFGMFDTLKEALLVAEEQLNGCCSIEKVVDNLYRVTFACVQEVFFEDESDYSEEEWSGQLVGTWENIIEPYDVEKDRCQCIYGSSDIKWRVNHLEPFYADEANDDREYVIVFGDEAVDKLDSDIEELYVCTKNIYDDLTNFNKTLVVLT